MKKVHALMAGLGYQHCDDNYPGGTLYAWMITGGMIIMSEKEPMFDPQTGEELETGDPNFDYADDEDYDEDYDEE